MSDIVQELTIEATPENVFHALTLSDGITGWWSNDATAELKVGSLTEIRFENGEVFKMEITDLEVGKKVHWRVRLSPHDWKGSTITWDLTPMAGRGPSCSLVSMISWWVILAIALRRRVQAGNTSWGA